MRFAPSPTGKLHIGNARTALFNWLFARKSKGSFILRIEDTDTDRSERIYETVVMDGLKWLDLDWDEGPDTTSSPFGPYRQSERFELYQEYVKILTEKGFVYPCYCTDEELKAERKVMLARRIAPRYSGRCRNLSGSDCRRLKSEGKRPALRFAVGNGSIEINDLIHGRINFKADLIGDFIIVRSDGIPTYNFTVVVDDILMKISHVIRGEDHLSNTPRQLLIYKALASRPPFFAHHALLLGQDRAKLGKRHGVTAVSAFMKRGYVPEALNNYLLWLGGGFNGTDEIFSIERMVEQFSLTRIGKNAAVFDEAKLRWINSKQLQRMSTGRIVLLWQQFASDFSADNERRLRKVVPLIIGNVETLDQLKRLADIFMEKDIHVSERAERMFASDDAKQVLSILISELNRIEGPILDDSFRSLFKRIQKKSGCKGRDLFMPVRAALTGMLHGPELDRLFMEVDRSVLIHRAEQALRTTHISKVS